MIITFKIGEDIGSFLMSLYYSSMTLLIMLVKNSRISTETIEVQYIISKTSRMGKNVYDNMQTKSISNSLSFFCIFSKSEMRTNKKVRHIQSKK